jgi:glutathione S-transferase
MVSKESQMRGLRVFTFSADWGLRSTGPFALKLLKWLDLAGLDYQQVFENNPGKGPKGKNPWIELEGERIGDTEIIIAMLAGRAGFDIDGGLSAERLSLGHAVRRLLEEHFHQVLEWELFVHPEGADYIRGVAAKALPYPLSALLAANFRGHFDRQLKARGIGRHEPQRIAAKGRADLDAIETLLGDGRYFGGERPGMADVAAYGLLSPMARWPMRTPVADELKRRPRLMRYLDRLETLTAAEREPA